MGGLVVFLLMLAVIASFSFVAANINNSDKKIENNQNSKALEFSTFTSAVCENREDAVYCEDEVFVNCNGEISKAVDVTECNGFKVDVPKVTGFAVFDEGWRDPRT